MKRTLQICPIIFGILLSLVGCDFPAHKATVDYIPVQEDKDDKWGMIDPNGKMLFENEFENTPSAVVNGVFYVKENNSYSLYLAKEKPSLIPSAEDLVYAGYYTEKLIPIVRKNERISLIDIKGETKFTLEPINGCEIINCNSLYHSGNLIITLQNGKKGTINNKGKIIIEPIYDYLATFSEGICIGVISSDTSSDKITIVGIDYKGKELFKLKDNYDPQYGFGFKGGRLAVKKGDVLGYVNSKGEFTKLPTKFKGYVPISENYFAFSNSDMKLGIVDKNNNIVLRAKYEDISYLKDDLFLVKNGEDYQVITAKGDIKVEIDEPHVINIQAFYECLGLYSAFWIAGGKEHSVIFYGCEGKAITKNDFYNVSFSGIGVTESIVSDYFDLSGVLNSIIEKITTNGFQNIKLGSLMKDYVDSNNPADYNSSYDFSRDIKDFDFNKATANLRITSNESIALEEAKYSYSEDDYYVYRLFEGYDYYWNPNSKVDKIELTLTGPASIFEKGKDQLKILLKNKGYELVEDKKEYAVLNDGKTYLTISCPGDLRKIELSLMSESAYKPNNSVPYLDSYNKAINNKSSAAYEDLEDTIVAVEVTEVVPEY